MKKKICYAVICSMFLVAALSGCGKDNGSTTAASGKTTEASADAGKDDKKKDEKKETKDIEAAVQEAKEAVEEKAEEVKKTEETVAEEAAQEAKEDIEAAAANSGQNIVMNFIGTYVSGRATMTVDVLGKTGAAITIEIGSSYAEKSVYTMSGEYTEEGGFIIITYNDGVKTNYVLNEDGTVASDEVEAWNMSGAFTINEDDSEIAWTNDQEPDIGYDVFSPTWAQ